MDKRARRLGALLFCAAGLWLGMAAAAAAGEAQPLADDPVLEARVLQIANELRCLVCQNETIAASRADLANDLRRQIRQQLQQGRSDREIIDYMVARYGDFVLFRPRLKATTIALWIGPFALLLVGAAILTMLIRRRGRGLTPLSEADHARAVQLLAEREGNR